MYRAARRATVNLHNNAQITTVNVKPYWVILSRGRILCDGCRELPLVFDTKELAHLCVHDNRLRGCEVLKMELEDLAHKCRDRAVPFDSFLLIQNPAQLGID